MAEHEIEHIPDNRATPADWRIGLLARMAAERAALLWELVGLDEASLTQQPVFERETAKDLLAHIAAWDELFAERTALILDGRIAEIASVDLSRNQAVHAERQDWPLMQALDAFGAARSAFLAAMGRASDHDLNRVRRLSWGRRSIRTWANWRYRHDAEHARDLARWRKRDRPARGAGPKAVLLAALHAGREELLSAAALIPADERATRPVCGHWSLKDLLGHVADWEVSCVEGLHLMAAGRPPDLGWTGELEEWNQEHLAARRDQAWERIWADLHATRRELMALLCALSQDELAQSFPSPRIVRPEASPYTWVLIWLEHDREHAAHIRAALELPWPRRLLHFVTEKPAASRGV